MIVEPNIAPLAKRLAEENNVNWRGLSGSGSDGRIIERDVLEYLAKVMAGDEDINPTSEPVPEGMEAWPEEDTKGFFESQVDAQLSDSGSNWPAADEDDILDRIEEEQLDFNSGMAESEADDLLKQSGVFELSEEEVLLTGDTSPNLELDDEIFLSQVDDLVADDLAADLVSDDDISEDVFLFDDDSSDDVAITEVDVVMEDFEQEDHEITNLFADDQDDQEDAVSEDMLIDQQLADDNLEDSVALDSSDLFVTEKEDIDEDLAALFVDPNEDEMAGIDLNPGLGVGIEDILASAQDPEETLTLDSSEIEDSSEELLADLNEQDGLELEASMDETLVEAVEEFEPAVEEIEEAEDITLDAEVAEEDLVDTELEIVEEMALEAEVSDLVDTEAEALEEIVADTEVSELDSTVDEIEAVEELAAEADISEMESLEDILEDFEDDLEAYSIEDIAAETEITEDTVDSAEDIEEVLYSQDAETEAVEELAAEADISEMESLEDVLEDSEEALDLELDGVADIAVESTEDGLELDAVDIGESEFSLETELALDDSVSDTPEEIAALEESEGLEPNLAETALAAGAVASIASQEEQEAEEIEPDSRVLAEEEVVELDSEAIIEEPGETYEAPLVMPSQTVSSMPVMAYGVLLRRHIDMSKLISARAEITDELDEAMPISTFLLRAAAKAAEKSGLSDPALLGFASFDSDGMKIKAIKSAKDSSLRAIYQELSETNTPVANIEEIELLVADMSGLEVDEAVLNVKAPVLTLGRINYGSDGAKSILTISGDISIEAGAKFISVFSELIASPIRLLV